MDGLGGTDGLKPITSGQTEIVMLDKPLEIPKLGPVQPLRAQIGASKCRVNLEQHLGRLAFVLKNIPQALWPSTAMLKDAFQGQTAIIVGGGPSLKETFHDLSMQLSDLGDKAKVFAPNKSHDWLIRGERNGPKSWLRHPIIPNFGVLTDPSEFVVDYQTPHKNVMYLLSTMLHWKVLMKFLKAFETQDGFLPASAFMWVPTYLEHGEEIETIAKTFPGIPMHFVSGGSTVGLRTINLAHFLGFAEVHLYGFDSCYAPGGGLYAYDKPYTVHDQVHSTIRCRQDGTGFKYRSNMMMAKQAMEFDDFLDKLPHLERGDYTTGEQHERGPMRVVVHGDGLIPWLAWKASGSDTLVQHSHPNRMAEKYGNDSYDYWEGRKI